VQDTNTIVVAVTDNVRALSGTNSFVVWGGRETAPTLEQVAGTTLKRGQQMIADQLASDPDLQSQTLPFSPPPPPSGAPTQTRRLIQRAGCLPGRRNEEQGPEPTRLSWQSPRTGSPPQAQRRGFGRVVRRSEHHTYARPVDEPKRQRKAARALTNTARTLI